MKVLIIDDDRWMRTVMSELLEGEGFATLEAGDGLTGLRLAEEQAVDVVILDLALPRRSGIEVLTMLKERQPTHDIPVIIVSAYALLLVGGAIATADGVLQKPFELDDLLDKVRAVSAERAPTPAPSIQGR